jgi:hypothetical protein
MREGVRWQRRITALIVGLPQFSRFGKSGDVAALTLL